MASWSVTVLGALAGGLLAGCIRTEKCGPPPDPNGGQLLFGMEAGYDQAAGLTQQVLIPEHVDAATAETWSFTDPTTTSEKACSDDYDRDFTGTTLEVTGDDIVSVTPKDNTVDANYRVLARCATTGYTIGEAQFGRVSVVIRAGSEVRYQDSVGIRCWEPNELAVAADKLSILVGELVTISHTAYQRYMATNPTTGEVVPQLLKLAGYGYELRGMDPPVAIQQDRPSRLYVIGVHAGTGVTLGTGTFEQPVALEVLPQP